MSTEHRSLDRQGYAAHAIWQTATRYPFVSIVVIVAAQHALNLGAKDLWFLDEVRHGGVLHALLERGDWLALRLNDSLYPDKPPVYFWYLAVLSMVFGSSAPWVIYMGLAGTVVMMLAATHQMALRLTQHRDVALAAVLILSSGYYMVSVTHYARMDFMFAAAITLAWTRFYLATARPEGVGRTDMVAGFAFTALAAMIKGPVGVLLPGLALVAVVLLRRRPGVLLDRAVLAGFALLVAVIAAWAGGIIALEGRAYFASLFDSQIVDRGLNRGGGLGVFRYTLTLPLVFLPWSLLVIFAPRAEGLAEDTRFLWAAALSGFVALSLISEKHEYYLVPLLVPLSIVGAKVLVSLPTRHRARFWALVAGLSAAIGAVLLVGALLAVSHAEIGAILGDYRATVSTLWAPGAVLVVGAGLLWRLRFRPRAALLGFAALQAVFISVAALRAIPQLDVVMSPRAVVAAMRPFAEEGYTVAAFDGGAGGFAYHLGKPYAYLPSADALWAWFARTPRAVAAVPHEYWRAVAAQSPMIGPVACVRYTGRGFLVLTRPAPEQPIDLSACDVGASRTR